MRLIQMAVIAAVILVLALFVLRPLLLGARRETREPPLRAGALPAPALAGLPVLDGEIEDPYPDPRPVPRPAADMPEGDGGNPVERLRRLIAERQTESVEILRSWMEEREDAR
jgi:flagellar M-ring protein FliF